MDYRLRHWASALLAKAERIGSGTDPVVIAIDGRCGAGKTSLAAEIARMCECNLFHMDDFYLRQEQRSAERYAQPGGNVDRERFLAEVLQPLSEGREFSYRPMLCPQLVLGNPVPVVPRHLNVVEGSYSCHPALRHYYDLRVFLDVSPTEQIRRIVHRNGEEKALEFHQRWIPLEELYFDALSVREQCDIVIVSDPQ